MKEDINGVKEDFFSDGRLLARKLSLALDEI